MTDTLDLAATYRAELKASALRYQAREPDGYAEILSATMADYAGQPAISKR